MSKIKTLKNLKIIFIESHRWRNSDLSSDGTKVKFSFFTLSNLLIFSFATGISFYNSSINDTVLNGILTFASIYSSLIIPVIIMVYDKYVQNPVSNLTEVQQKSEGAKARSKIFKNFTSRFVFTALETVAIAILIIILILLFKSCLDAKFNYNLLEYEFCKINTENTLNFLKLLLMQSEKIIFIFLMIKFLWFIFYSIGALGDFFYEGLKE